MSDLLLHILVKNVTPGQAIGIKEALAMDLEEKYGGDVRVLRVEVREPEQLALHTVLPKR